jgi:hypothetical protein
MALFVCFDFCLFYSPSHAKSYVYGGLNYERTQQQQQRKSNFILVSLYFKTNF